MQRVKLVNIRLIDLASDDLRVSLGLLLHALGEHLLTSINFIVEEANVLLEHFDLNKALLGLFKVNVLMHVSPHAHLTRARCQLLLELVPASNR